MRLKTYYNQVLCPDLLWKYNIDNIMSIPKLKKIVLSNTSSLMVADPKYGVVTMAAMELISGQKALTTSSKSSIAAFKLRKNMLIGCKVTLRGDLMYLFLEKLVHVVLPRMELPSYSSKSYNFVENKQSGHSLQGSGAISVTNLLLFPELEDHYEIFEKVRGMDINFVSSSNPAPLQLKPRAVPHSKVVAKQPRYEVKVPHSVTPSSLPRAVVNGPSIMETLMSGFQFPSRLDMSFTPYK